MHMSDALLSPTVGFAFCAVSAALLGYSARKIRAESDESKIPLMGVLSAFVFAAQMINFSIPGTGSSGHLSGGLLLAVFLGPYRGFLAIASVLVIQCLFFADGGLMALGANIFNMGFWACFIVYPLLWRPWLEAGFSRPRLAFISILSAMIILLLGALGVVLETSFSGIADLPLSTFMMFMLPIHLGIALVEGAATLAIILFIRRTRPELLGILAEEGAGPSRLAYAKGAAVLLTMALFTGAVLSRFASTRPDGLEWSLAKTRAAKAAGKPVFSASPAATMAADSARAESGSTDSIPGSGASGVSGTSGLYRALGAALALALAIGLGFAIRYRGGKPARAGTPVRSRRQEVEV